MSALFQKSDGMNYAPIFGQLIWDGLRRTEDAMTQAHTFKAIELAILVARQAARLA